MKTAIRPKFLSWCILVFSLQQATAQLNAGFNTTSIAGCTPLVVQFQDASTGSPTSWKWDLGNGAISFLQNPSTVYFNPGKYSIKLVIRNANQKDSIVKVNYITVNALPTPSFRVSDTTGCYPLRVAFTDQSQPQEGSIVKWEWDMGDGSVSNLQDPVHTYTGAGNYNVILRVTNSSGCINTLSRAQYIKIKEGVKADFSFTSTHLCKPPSLVNFTNKSTGTGILSYQWSFGDGSLSTMLNPSKTYLVIGSYDVQLITKNNFGCSDTVEKKNFVPVGLAKAALTAPDSVCVNKPFSLINSSQPRTSNIKFDFGDGTSSVLANPIKTYSSPGTYHVKLIVDFGGCSDTAKKTIYVVSKPVIDFTADQTASCRAPFTVHFQNLSPGANTYKWWFGDSTSSTQENPIHTYTQNGEYNVQLIVINGLGCTDTLKKTTLIKVKPSSLNLLNPLVMGCAPVVFTPVYTLSSETPITGFLWNFGDGTTSTSPNPVHTYNIPGIYPVSVSFTTADGCVINKVYPKAVRVGEKPIANFVVSPTDACASVPIQFINQSTGIVTDWLWKFGDGATDTSRNTSHTYSDTGYFTVTLVASYNGCSDELTLPNVVHIKPPIAKFLVNTSCADPFTFSFVNHSIGAKSWFWNFGDGTTSTVEHPVHTFAVKGSYMVTLTVTDNTCVHSTSYNANIIVEKANFSASSTMVCRGDSILLQPFGFNPANIIGYRWSFGYGTDTSRIIKVAYPASGKYTIQLVITNIAGCTDTMKKIDYLVVNGPVANFNVVKDFACLNLGGNIEFTDASSDDGRNAIRSRLWDFGDGTTASVTTTTITHTYSTSGSYNVHLKVTDIQGCSDNISNANLLHILDPKANFTSNDSMSCSNKPVSFTDKSSGAPLNYSWQFGDGTGSTLQQPVHHYATVGQYEVFLQVIDNYGCRDSLLKPAYIQIDEPTALFSLSDSIGTCPPLIVSFHNASTYSKLSTWDFGDGTGTATTHPVHYYNYPGIYQARLIVISPGGCEDTLIKQIVIKGPTGTFVYDKTISCNPGDIAFTATTQNTQKLVWDFSDGVTINTAQTTIGHTYSSMGEYLPKIILEDHDGCKVPILGTDTIHIFGVASLFNKDKILVCDADSVSFRDSSLSNDFITGYEWQFGDGSTSTEKNPAHTYTSTGIYPIHLKVTTLNGCTDIATDITPIKVAQSPQVAIRGGLGACVPADIDLFGEIIAADTAAFKWQWDFGNQIAADLQYPPKVLYTTAGSYQVQMTATSAAGCTTSKIKQVDIYPIPPLKAGNDVIICEQKSVELAATGADKYVWSPAADLSCTNCASPIASPITDRIYHVFGESVFGCKAADSLAIRVKHPFIMQVGSGDTLCKGESFPLRANNAELYAWSPSLGLDDAHIRTPRAAPLQTTIYRVIGYDSVGCFYDTGFIKLVVYPYPTIDAGSDKTVGVGFSTTLHVIASEDVTSIKWQPSPGLSCNNCASPIANPKQTTTYRVSVTNGGGCPASDEVAVFVVCNDGNIFMPNTFSPNGDGTNDVFFPRGTGLFRIRSMRIFNRWGEQVFEMLDFRANDITKGWKGDYKNKPVSSDVYVYMIEVICENSAILTYSGNIMVTR